MEKFRTRVSFVEAVRWGIGTDLRDKIPPAILTVYEREGRAVVTTPDGNIEVRSGDWIVKDESGAYIPMSDELFKQRYEVA